MASDAKDTENTKAYDSLGYGMALAGKVILAISDGHTDSTLASKIKHVNLPEKGVKTRNF